MIDILDNRVQFIIGAHKNTNHLYDGYLPYEFHLRMVAANCERFRSLLVNEDIELACWGHDLLEDTRLSYNDAKAVLGYETTEIIYAVTNHKGRNRKERANDAYYNEIRNTCGASFVKLCDRIANVEYSKMVGSSMFNMYMKENDYFISAILAPNMEAQHAPLVNRLKELFNSLNHKNN